LRHSAPAAWNLVLIDPPFDSALFAPALAASAANSCSDSSSTQQGNEFNKASQKCDGPSDEDSYRCPKNPDGSCPPVPDMTQYIKKDAIPCWGCSVDY
jgi:hypothetical protein